MPTLLIFSVSIKSYQNKQPNNLSLLRAVVVINVFWLTRPIWGVYSPLRCWRQDSDSLEADSMVRRETFMDDAQLRTVWQQRQGRSRISSLAEPLGVLMKQELAKRVKQLGQLSTIWDAVVPSPIQEHTALDGLHRGVLTVLVDSASHRFTLQTLLTGGLMKEIQSRFDGALNKIRLVPGQFYSIDIETGQKRYEF